MLAVTFGASEIGATEIGRMTDMPGADLAASLAPLRAMCSALGLEVFQLTSDMRLQRSIPATFHTFVIFVVTIVAYGVDILHSADYRDNMLLTIFVCRIAIVVSSLIASLVGLVGMCMNRKSREEMMQRFVEVDKVLLHCAHSHYKTWSNVTKIFISLSCIFLTIICVLDLYAFPQTTLGSASKVAGYLRDYINIAMVGNYVNWVLLVQRRLAYLNTRLHNYQCLEISRTLHGMHVDEWIPENGELHLLVVVYSKLCRIVALVNSALGMQVLFSLLSIFVHVLGCIHTSLIALLVHGHCGRLMLVSTVGWVAINVAQVVAMGCCCGATVDTEADTRALVQELWVRRRATPGVRQLFHQVCSRRLVFRATGFFLLDLRFLAAMAGSVSSYILVLQQLSVPQ